MANVKVDSGEIEVDEIEKKVHKTSKSQNLSKYQKTVRSLDFFTLGAKLAFTKLRQVFLKVSILDYFDPARHIRIGTDVSGYTIGRVFRQLPLKWFESIASVGLLFL